MHIKILYALQVTFFGGLAAAQNSLFVLPNNAVSLAGVETDPCDNAVDVNGNTMVVSCQALQLNNDYLWDVSSDFSNIVEDKNTVTTASAKQKKQTFRLKEDKSQSYKSYKKITAVNNDNTAISEAAFIKDANNKLHGRLKIGGRIKYIEPCKYVPNNCYILLEKAVKVTDLEHCEGTKAPEDTDALEHNHRALQSIDSVCNGYRLMPTDFIFHKDNPMTDSEKTIFSMQQVADMNNAYDNTFVNGVSLGSKFKISLNSVSTISYPNMTSNNIYTHLTYLVDNVPLKPGAVARVLISSHGHGGVAYLGPLSGRYSAAVASYSYSLVSSVVRHELAGHLLGNAEHPLPYSSGFAKIDQHGYVYNPYPEDPEKNRYEKKCTTMPYCPEYQTLATFSAGEGATYNGIPTGDAKANNAKYMLAQLQRKADYHAAACVENKDQTTKPPVASTKQPSKAPTQAQGVNSKSPTLSPTPIGTHSAVCPPIVNLAGNSLSNYATQRLTAMPGNLAHDTTGFVIPETGTIGLKIYQYAQEIKLNKGDVVRIRFLTNNDAVINIFEKDAVTNKYHKILEAPKNSRAETRTVQVSGLEIHKIVGVLCDQPVDGFAQRAKDAAIKAGYKNIFKSETDHTEPETETIAQESGNTQSSDPGAIAAAVLLSLGAMVAVIKAVQHREKFDEIKQFFEDMIRKNKAPARAPAPAHKANVTAPSSSGALKFSTTQPKTSAVQKELEALRNKGLVKDRKKPFEK